MYHYFFFHWLYSHHGPWPPIFQFHDHFTDGRTAWTSDQLVARPLPKHRQTQTQNKHIHIPNIHALCGIRTNDPGSRASEDSTCLRPLGYRDRHISLIIVYFSFSRPWCTWKVRGQKKKYGTFSSFTFRPLSHRFHVRIWNIIPATNLIFTKRHEFPQPNTCWRGNAHLNSIIEASHEDNLCGNEEPCIRVSTVSAGITEDGMFVYSVHNLSQTY
jgi:hypothetical protein